MANSSFPEVAGFGTASLDWPAIPDRHTVPEVAAQYARHRIAAYLHTHNVSTTALAEQLGDKPPAWRSKLNGNRNLSFDDFIGLLMLFPDLREHVVPRSENVDHWLPPSYAGAAAGRVDGSAIPRFGAPADIDWPAATAGIERWWSAAVADGTANWTVQSPVLAYQIVNHLDNAGLPRRLATPSAAQTQTQDPGTAHSTSEIRVDWLLHDVSIHVVWLDPFGESTTDRTRARLAAAADAFWSDPDADSTAATMVIIAAPSPVMDMLNEILADGAIDDHNTVLSIQHAEKMRKVNPGSVPDVALTRFSAPGAPLLWALIK
ncbi:hypothetical protein QWI29_15120 [Mycolicibacterium neoaurum]|uniref:hypothetical protein n=1 Tax=Mycolicibacterium neoaurum TaxID=1795 RepID=UPI0026732931|nr:hypothetical protein [Mycolicibacterium neoaurum]MDO3401368.1 hypothetical protein [Mycolicibacterium neoaurum]